MVSYRIIVQPSKNCDVLLRFIDGIVNDLNKSGVWVRVNMIDPSDIDDDSMRLIKRYSLSRFPVIIGPDERPHIGLDIAKQVLARHVRGSNAAPRSGGGFAKTGDPTMDYLMSECFAVDPRTGKVAPQSIAEVSTDDALAGDMGKRTDELTRRLTIPNPGQRKTEAYRSAAPQQPPPNRQPVFGREDDEYADDRYQDNIADDDNYTTPISRTAHIVPPTGDQAEDELDKRMLQSLLQNM